MITMIYRNNGRGKRFGQVSHFVFWRSLIIAAVFVCTGTIILAYRTTPINLLNLRIGEPAPENIHSPRQLVYVSELRTNNARADARSKVDTVFTPPNPKVVRTQMQRLRAIFDYLDVIRADEYDRDPQKAEWVRAIPDLSLSDIVIAQILTTNEQTWNDIRSESRRILNSVLREEIRETQVGMQRRQLANQISLEMPDAQSSIIVAITEDLIKPNTFRDDERTEALKQEAAEAIDSVSISIEKGELIISAGEIIGPEELEKLQELGFQEIHFVWLRDFAVPSLLMLLTTAVAGIYLVQYTPRVAVDHRRLILLATLLLIFLLFAKLIIPAPTISFYLYPISALTMMIAVLVDVQLAFLLTPIVAIWAVYIAPDSLLPLVTFLVLSGWTGPLALNKGRHVSALIWATVFVVLINISIILTFSLAFNLDQPLAELATPLSEGVLNGILSAGITLTGLLGIGKLMGITTAMQLSDLGRPTHPLLKQLLLNAPGTYHHSLMVSNLAEQAAERIGADATMVRVMAYYHDIGKMQRPYFFVENQPEGVNVHEKLDPKVSAQIIISHVTDGLELAKKYRLPRAIQDGILQHHGTSLVKFFYYQAVKAANEKNTSINENDFHYPGPRPQDKENGILMLADVTESVVRALKPGSVEEIDDIVQKMIAEKLETGQLNNCDLTIADLHKIRKAFVDMLQGVHHPRIKYPDPVKPKPDGEEQPPTEPSSAPTDPTTDPMPPAIPKKPAAAPSPLRTAQPSRLIRQE